MALWQQALEALARINARNTSKATKPKENTISVYQGTLHIVDAFTWETVAFSEVDEVFSFWKNKLATDTFQMYIDKWHIITDLSAQEIHEKFMNHEWRYLDRPSPKTVSVTEREMHITQNSVDSILMRSLLSANPGASKFN